MPREARWPARNDILWLAGLSAVRAAVPLIALVVGGALPGFPSYSYQGPRGDASGYIDTARAIISAGAGFGLLLPVLFAVVVAGALAARWAWRRFPGRPPLGDRRPPLRSSPACWLQ